MLLKEVFFFTDAEVFVLTMDASASVSPLDHPMISPISPKAIGTRPSSDFGTVRSMTSRLKRLGGRWEMMSRRFVMFVEIQKKTMTLKSMQRFSRC